MMRTYTEVIVGELAMLCCDECGQFFKVRPMTLRTLGD